jgi:hypothetical protein
MTHAKKASVLVLSALLGFAASASADGQSRRLTVSAAVPGSVRCDADGPTLDFIVAVATGYDSDGNEVCGQPVYGTSTFDCPNADYFTVQVGFTEQDGSFNPQCTGYGDWDGNSADCSVSLTGYEPGPESPHPSCEELQFSIEGNGDG